MGKAFDSLFQTIREQCDEETWSQAVRLTRVATFIEESSSDDEIVVRVLDDSRLTAVVVYLWPEAEDWSSDARDSEESLIFCAASIIQCKHQKVKKLPGLGDASPTLPEESRSTTRLTSSSAVATLLYRLSPMNTSQLSSLAIQRFLRSDSEEIPLPGSLLNYLGGIKSGRIKGAKVLATQTDFQIDELLGSNKNTTIDIRLRDLLLKPLRDCTLFSPEGKQLSIGLDTFFPKLLLNRDQRGFCLSLVDSNLYPGSGLIIVDNSLCSLPAYPIVQIVSQLWQERTVRFPSWKKTELVSQIIPELKELFCIEDTTQELTTALDVPPTLTYDFVRDERRLRVKPRLVYGSPAIAEVLGNDLVLLKKGFTPKRNLTEESKLQDQVERSYNLQLGREVELCGDEAVTLARQLIAREGISNEVLSFFSAQSALAPCVALEQGKLSVDFVSPTGRPCPMSEIFNALKQGESFFFDDDLGYLTLPSDWLKTHGLQIESILDAQKQFPRLPHCLLPSAIDLCLETGGRISSDLVTVHRQLLHQESLPAFALPEDFSGVLRDYQHYGASWLNFLKAEGWGALLADDMGLGKTLQALLTIEKGSLVIAPTSVLTTWMTEIAKFRPTLKVNLYWGPKRELDDSADITLTSYALLRLDSVVLSSKSWSMVVLDESQAIKNPESQTAKAANSLRAGFRLAMSGTPLENKVEELCSQLNFLFPSLIDFGKILRTYKDSLPSNTVPAELRRIASPFILRRTKEQVAPELPPRTESIIQVQLSDEELNLYESLKLASQAQVKALLETKGSTMQILELLLRLRQCVCDTSLVPGSLLQRSSKLDTLEAMLAEVTAEGHRALVFSQWTSLLDSIEPRLKALQIPFLRLDGSTPNRRQVVADYQTDSGPPVLIMSLKAGGVGLNLTAADYVFFCDPWWNPAVEDQASSRAHRIGQTKPVFVYRLIARNTVEERIIELQKMKMSLGKSLFEKETDEPHLTRDDLAYLLS